MPLSADLINAMEHDRLKCCGGDYALLRATETEPGGLWLQHTLDCTVPYATPSSFEAGPIEGLTIPSGS